MPAKTDAAAIKEIRDMLSKAGLEPETKLKPLDRSQLSAMLNDGVALVDVCIRREEPVGGMWSKSRRWRDLPTVQNVPLETLIENAEGWLIDRYGGGKYEVQLLNSEMRSFGPVYQWAAEFAGPMKQAEHAKTSSESSAFQQQLEAMGFSAAQAATIAQLQQPGGAAQQDDDMANMMQMLLLAQMMNGGGSKTDSALEIKRLELAAREAEQRQARQDRLDREERERRDRLELAKAAPAHSEDALLKKLDEMEKRHQAELAALRAEQKESRLEAQILELNRKIAELSSKPAGPDPTVVMMTEMWKASATEKAAEQAQNGELMKLLLSGNQNRAAEFDALMRSQVEQAKFAMDMQRLRSEEPIKAMEVISRAGGMMAQMAQAQNRMLMDMQGNPFLDAIRETSAMIPELIQGVLGRDQTRGGSYDSSPATGGADEEALSRELEIARQAMGSGAVKAPPVKSAPVVQQVEEAPDATREQALAGSAEGGGEEASAEGGEAGAAPEDAGVGEADAGQSGAGAGDDVQAAGAVSTDDRKVAAQILLNLDLEPVEAAAELLETPEGVAVLFKLASENVNAAEVGRELADAIARLEATVNVGEKALERLKGRLETNFGWSRQKVTHFAKAWVERVTELVEAAQRADEAAA